MRRFDNSHSLEKRLQSVIPGGAHTYAKGSDQFPVGIAPVLTHGSGCTVWDVDGNEFLEYGMGLRAVTLGHGHPEVTAAVARAASLGTNFVRPSKLELTVAEQFLDTVSGSDMVKFTKDGSTANTAAVKLARAFTGRARVAICADHPFYSYDDWAMVTTPLNAGIPEGVAQLTLTFPYDDLEAIETLFEEYPDEIACVLLEPERTRPPSEGFLAALAQLCRDRGALLILDECVTGFRWSNGGAQEVYGVIPDLATWGKGMANGFSLSALSGRAEVMELGGLDHDRARVFLLSTTHGAEHTGLAAGAATMRIYASEPVTETLATRGRALRDELTATACSHGVEKHFTIVGHDACLFYETRGPDGEHSSAFRTLFLQETIRRGLLAPSFVLSYAHTSDAIERTVMIVDAALRTYREALEGGVETRLEGRPVRSVYRRYNASTSPFG